MENLQPVLLAIDRIIQLLFHTDFKQWITAVGTSFALITAAEIGDKSQLVCMTLAARYRALPVFLGAFAAFIILNTFAVSFGVVISSWIPKYIVAAIVTLLFTAFGIHSLLINSEEEKIDISRKSSHSIFLTTLLLITVAEFGDKTQLAVVALSSTYLAIAVWIGATVALAGTSALGVFAGRTILQAISLTLLHRISGIIFLVLAAFAGYNVFKNLPDTSLIL